MQLFDNLGTYLLLAIHEWTCEHLDVAKPDVTTIDTADDESIGLDSAVEQTLNSPVTMQDHGVMFGEAWRLATRIMLARRENNVMIASKLAEQVTSVPLFISALYVINDVMALSMGNDNAIQLLTRLRDDPPNLMPQ